MPFSADHELSPDDPPAEAPPLLRPAALNAELAAIAKAHDAAASKLELRHHLERSAEERRQQGDYRERDRDQGHER